MLIENMNIDVRSGQTVAIVGPTGAGKTTLVNLLMRFYEVNDGSITIDGVDITQMKRGDLAQLVRYGASGYMAVQRHDSRQYCLWT